MRGLPSRVSLCCLLLYALPLAADPQSRSWSTWRWQEQQVEAVYTVPRREASRLAGSDTQSPPDRLLSEHLRKSLSLSSNSGDCELERIDPERSVQAYLRLRLSWRCPAGSQLLTIGNRAFFKLAPGHIHFASINRPDGAAFEQIFSRRQPQHSIALTAGDAQEEPPQALLPVLQTYVLFGFEHILVGLDHIAFLLGLMLLSLAWRDVLLVVTGFTVGHSITLGLTVLGVITPNQLWVEGLIGYTIALVAVENLLAGDRRQFAAALLIGAVLALLAVFAAMGLPGPDPLSMLGLALFSLCYLQLADSRKRVRQMRPALTLLFGLVHGFGFAGVMLEVGLPQSAVVPALLGFNLGVELGQIAIVGVLALIGMLSWRKLPLQLPANTALCGLGVFWFVNRLYF